MTFARSFVLNFLLVFFVNRIAPGVFIDLFEDVFNLGADLLFSVSVGFCNASIYPVLKMMHYKPSLQKIGVFAAIISFGAYGLAWIFPMGVVISNFIGFFFAGAAVSCISFFTNYLEMKRFSK